MERREGKCKRERKVWERGEGKYGKEGKEVRERGKGNVGKSEGKYGKGVGKREVLEKIREVWKRRERKFGMGREVWERREGKCRKRGWEGRSAVMYRSN